MIGPIGSHLSTLCRLALHISDIPIHAVDTSKQNTFLDGLRSAVRQTGAEGKALTLFFTVSLSNKVLWYFFILGTFVLQFFALWQGLVSCSYDKIYF